MSEIKTSAICGQAICGQTICGNIDIVSRKLKITKLPNKKIFVAGDLFDSTGMEVSLVNSDGSQTRVTNYRISPNGLLSVNTKYVTITYSDLSVKLPIKVAVKVKPYYMSERRVKENGVWGGWTFSDLNGKIQVSGTENEQNRTKFCIPFQEIQLGYSESAGLELWLKKAANNAAVQGHVKINNIDVPIEGDYVKAYIGKKINDETGNLYAHVAYGDVDVNFEDEAYIVLCRDIDPATFNANKQILLAADATANMDLLMGKADIIFTDFAADDTLMGLEIQHVYVQDNENCGCGSHFRLNLYERLTVSSIQINEVISTPYYISGYGHRHGFNPLFYIDRIDYENAGPDFDPADPSIYVRDYVKNLSEITYDESTKKYYLQEWELECDQVTVNEKKYLSEMPASVGNLNLSYLDSTKPVNWLKGGNTTKGFNKDGRLVMISDEFGNYIRINYNTSGLITRVIDRKGNELNFSYNNGLLNSITDTLSNKKVEYAYTSGKLTKIKYCKVESNGASTVYKTLDIAYTQIYKNGELCDGISTITSSDKLMSEMHYEGADIKAKQRA